MDETSDSLERSSSTTLCFSEAADRPGGFSLSDSLYMFEHGVVTSLAAMPDTPSPQEVGGRRRRRRRSRRSRRMRGLPSHAEEEGAAEAAAVVQPPSLVSARRSKRRRVSEARPAGRPDEEDGNAPSPARDGVFPNVWLEPCQPSSSSSSSSSLFSTSEGEAATAANKPAGPGPTDWDRRSKSDADSLSFLTAEERAWLCAEAAAADQSAPPPSREIVVGDGEDEEAGVHGAQVEGDALLARQLQEQFDREHRLALPFRGRQRCHHNHRGNRQNHAEPLAGEQRQDAQSSGTRQRRQNSPHGTLSSHSAEQMDNHTLDLLPDSDCPWLAAVQRAAFLSLMNSNGGNDLTIGQPRGRGRGGGSRRPGRDAQLLEALGGNEYRALLDFEERQGTVVPKRKLNKREINMFPTKTYDPAQSAGNARCQICFCDYTCGEELRMLTCFHDYHVKCIDRWLKVNATCPVCRCNMAERVPGGSSMTPYTSD